MERRYILLTGATGLLGQFILRDLLARNYPVAVLVRDTPQACAAERLAQIIALSSEFLQQKLRTPLVLSGELGLDGLGLTGADRRWLQRRCASIIHSAANLSFKETQNGEPWRTNVEGTRSLLEICREVGVAEWHHLSTAFVCGTRAGIIKEEDHQSVPAFHNPYEESKFQAEQLVRQAAGIHATIYRPAVIVGDSRTGHTSSFTGLYRFLELAVRLLSATSGADEGSLPLRLPLSGDESWNLVPVDWVARAVVELMSMPRWHGRTFHLVSRAPIATRSIHDVAAQELQLRGAEFVGRDGAAERRRVEELFLAGVKEYWPYLGGNPVFDFSNTAAALPHLPPPLVDAAVLRRLIAFAVKNRWGRGPLPCGKFSPSRPRAPKRLSPQQYIERKFPQQARRSNIARAIGLDITVGIDLSGPGGGQWSCIWSAGELTCVKRGLEERTDVTYRTDTATFEAVVNGWQTPQEAFFEERIQISGDLETALKVAALFEHFLSDNSAGGPGPTEVMDASSCQT